MIDGRQDQHHEVKDHADHKIRFERLFLGFMAKQLLAEDGARPPADYPADQQGRLRNPAPGFAGRHFVGAVDHKRQRAGEQKPHRKRVRGQGAARSDQGQKEITEDIEVHGRQYQSSIRRAMIRDPAGSVTGLAG